MFRERDMTGSGYRSYRDGDAEDRRRNFDSRSLGQGNRGEFDRMREGQPFNNFVGQKRDRLGVDPKLLANQGREGQSADPAHLEVTKSARWADAICFWCRQEGHHQADCTNPPFYFRCKESGHIVAKCPSAKNNSIHMYGFGFPNQGYYCLKVPGANKIQQPKGNLGKVTVKSGVASEEKIEKELKHLIDVNWQWKVRRLSDCDYIASFPNKKILKTFSRSSSLELALYNITVSIMASDMNPEVSSLLQTGWIHLTNVPDPARNVEAVTAIAELAGEVIAVDEVTLIREEPIRVKIRARDISKINGSIEYFVDGVGFLVRFAPEVKPQKHPPVDMKPPPGRKKDEDDMDDEEDDLYESDDDPIKSLQADGDAGGSSSQTNRSGQGYKGKQQKMVEEQVKDGQLMASGGSPNLPSINMITVTQETMQAHEEGEKLGDQNKAGSSSSEVQHDCKGNLAVEDEWRNYTNSEISPLAAYDPKTDTVIQLGVGDGGGSDPEDGVMTTQEDQIGEDWAKDDLITIHTEGGGVRLLHKNKWPKLIVGMAEGCEAVSNGVDCKPEQRTGIAAIEKGEGCNLAEKESNSLDKQQDHDNMATEAAAGNVTLTAMEGNDEGWEVQKAAGSTRTKQKIPSSGGDQERHKKGA
jgi:hypothetical protein